mmetsp:Transcript_7404/g.11261  ORF Transcript_7404/g.11261 Transcript_7404/m.11261 type:complete len:237 (+) Transcript_7404:31-741(+)
MKFTIPAIAALSGLATTDSYSCGPLFRLNPAFQVATRSPFRNDNRELSAPEAIVSDIAAVHQLMRADIVAARQKMENVLHQPGYQMFDNGEQFQISLDVPGVKASDIKVDLEEDGKVLNLSGVRSFSKGDGTYSSTFSRSFQLDPSLDTDNLTANLHNGVLTISAPKDLKKVEEAVKSIAVTEFAIDDGTSDEANAQASQEHAGVTEEDTSDENEEGETKEDNIDLDDQDVPSGEK